MSTFHVEPGDVELKRSVLMNRARTVKLDIQSQIISFSIYEDMLAPCLYAEIDIMDGINLLQAFPIIGEEFIELEFQTPGFPAPAVYRFAVHSVTNNRPEKARVSLYTLKCVSEEQLTSAAKMVQLVGKGSYSDLVTDILKRELSTKKPIYVEPTRGTSGNVIPKLKPLAAIDYLRQMSISVDTLTSAFMFFETQFGFQFRTIESLINQNLKKPIRQFKYVEESWSSTQAGAHAQRNIIKFEVVNRVDSVEKIQTGSLNNIVSGYDLISKGVRQTKHELPTAINTFVTTDAKSQAPTSTQLYQEYGTSPADTFFMSFDSSRGLVYRDLSTAARRAYTSMLTQNVIRILIHGESNITAGDLLEIKLPSISSETSTRLTDTLIAGNYLIVRLRHIITRDVRKKHMIAADIIKVGYTV